MIVAEIVKMREFPYGDPRPPYYAPVYRGQTNIYLPSTFVEDPHFSAKQSAVPTNVTNLLVNEIKPRKLNTQEARSSQLINQSRSGTLIPFLRVITLRFK